MDTTHILIRAAEAAGLDIRSYSGRGMYDRQCVGIDTDDSEARTIAALVRGCRDISRNESDLDSLLEAIEDTKSDNMGLGIIIYWPDIPASEDGDGEGDGVRP